MPQIKRLLLIILVSAITINGHAQTPTAESANGEQPGLQETYEWLISKIILYIKEIKSTGEGSLNITNPATISYTDDKEPFLIFKEQLDSGFKTITCHIYPMRIAFFTILDNSIDFESAAYSCILYEEAVSYNGAYNGYVHRQHFVEIVMDMGKEENLEGKMEEALKRFIALKKQKN